MKKFFLTAFAVVASVMTLNSNVFAKGGGTHEFGFNYRYDSAKSPTTSYSFHELQTFYLVPVKPFWVGSEVSYANNRNPSYATSLLEVGVVAKYWIVDPGGPVAFNIYSGIGFGKEDNGSDPHATTTFKAGPELAWFIWDGAAISTRLQYATRKAGPNYTVIALHSGISLFF